MATSFKRKLFKKKKWHRIFPYQWDTILCWKFPSTFVWPTWNMEIPNKQPKKQRNKNHKTSKLNFFLLLNFVASVIGLASSSFLPFICFSFYLYLYFSCVSVCVCVCIFNRGNACAIFIFIYFDFISNYYSIPLLTTRNKKNLKNKYTLEKYKFMWKKYEIRVWYKDDKAF